MPQAIYGTLIPPELYGTLMPPAIYGTLIPPELYGTLMPPAISLSLRWYRGDTSRWVLGWHHNMLHHLEWVTLEQQHWNNNTRLTLMYKLVNKIVCMNLSQYVSPVTRYSRHKHHNSLTGVFSQIGLSVPQ